MINDIRVSHFFFLSIYNAHSAAFCGERRSTGLFVKLQLLHLVSFFSGPNASYFACSTRSASETDRPRDMDQCQYSWCICWANTLVLSRNIVHVETWILWYDLVKKNSAYAWMNFQYTIINEIPIRHQCVITWTYWYSCYAITEPAAGTADTPWVRYDYMRLSCFVTFPGLGQDDTRNPQSRIICFVRRAL